LFGFVVELTGCWIHLILKAGSTYFWCKWVGIWIEFHVVDWSVLIFFLLQRKTKFYLCVLGFDEDCALLLLVPAVWFIIDLQQH
jgi:hypothetical protein